jgi:hypothetical protein
MRELRLFGAAFPKPPQVGTTESKLFFSNSNLTLMISLCGVAPSEKTIII